MKIYKSLEIDELWSKLKEVVERYLSTVIRVKSLLLKRRVSSQICVDLIRPRGLY